MDKSFVKLSDLVGDQFVTERVSEYRFKTWDNEQKKYLTSESWQKGYTKSYTLDTDKGLLDVSASQLGSMLETVSYKGESTLIGKPIKVSSNGKTGIDIRYYFNPGKEDKTIEETVEQIGW